MLLPVVAGQVLVQLPVCLPDWSTTCWDMQSKLRWLAGKDLKRLQRQVSSRKLQKFWKSFRTTRSTTAQLAQAFLDTGIPTSAQVEPSGKDVLCRPASHFFDSWTQPAQMEAGINSRQLQCLGRTNAKHASFVQSLCQAFAAADALPWYRA